MPYKHREDKRRYDRRRYKRLRNALIKALGGMCAICGGTLKLQIHHKTPYGQRSRPNSMEYFKPEGKELRCQRHHIETPSYGKRVKNMGKTQAQKARERLNKARGAIVDEAIAKAKKLTHLRTQCRHGEQVEPCGYRFHKACSLDGKQCLTIGVLK